MDDAGVAEAVLVELGFRDRLVHVAHAHEGNEGHHLLDRHERVAFVGLAEQQLSRRGNGSCRCRRLARGVLTEKVFAGHVVLVLPFAYGGDRHAV